MCICYAIAVIETFLCIFMYCKGRTDLDYCILPYVEGA